MCDKSHLHFEFTTRKDEGLLLYNGPIVPPEKDEIMVSDYIAVELERGYPRLLLDFGSGTLELRVKTKKALNDGDWHRLDIFWDTENVRMVVDYCKSADIGETDHNFQQRHKFYGLLQLNWKMVPHQNSTIAVVKRKGLYHLSTNI